MGWMLMAAETENHQLRKVYEREAAKNIKNNGC